MNTPDPTAMPTLNKITPEKTLVNDVRQDGEPSANERLKSETKAAQARIDYLRSQCSKRLLTSSEHDELLSYTRIPGVNFRPPHSIETELTSLHTRVATLEAENERLKAAGRDQEFTAGQLVKENQQLRSKISSMEGRLQ